MAARSAVDNAVRVVATSITPDQAAANLGIDESRVRHRIAERSLYACKLANRIRLPAWQFTDDGQPIPGLRAALAALPEGLHPLEVDGFMTLPRQDLLVEGEALSARDWLLSGGNVDAVVETIAGFDEW